MTGTEYWLEQRYQDTFFAIHGHEEEREDNECSLCGPYPEDGRA